MGGAINDDKMNLRHEKERRFFVLIPHFEEGIGKERKKEHDTKVE